MSLSLLSADIGYVGIGDYVIGSLRKWLPIPDGGILLSKKQIELVQEPACNDYTMYYFIAQVLKYNYLKRGINSREQKAVFLSYNHEGIESLFSDYTIRKMSRVSLDIMKGLNIETIRNKRNSNYDYLQSLLKEIPQVKIVVDRKGTMTPLGMVILCEKRDELLQYLISKDIYCNVHWKSNESIKQFQESEFLSSRCITIPCDQRYGESEMALISQRVAEFYGV